MDADETWNCRRCRTPQTLLVSLDLRGVDHGLPGHETVFDFTHIELCPACGAGLYRHYSHDCWDHSGEEPWDMWWYAFMEPEDMQRLNEGLSTCPRPTDVECDCAAHASLQRSVRDDFWFPADELWTLTVRLTDEGWPALVEGEASDIPLDPADP